MKSIDCRCRPLSRTTCCTNDDGVDGPDTHSARPRLSLSLSCFSGIKLGLNPSDSIAQSLKTQPFYKYAPVSVAGLLRVSYPVFNDSLQLYSLTLRNQESLSTMHMLMPRQSPCRCTSSSSSKSFQGDVVGISAVTSILL